MNCFGRVSWNSTSNPFRVCEINFLQTFIDTLRIFTSFLDISFREFLLEFLWRFLNALLQVFHQGFFFFKDPSRNILAMVVSGISTEFLQEIFNSLMQCFEDSSNNSSRPLLWVHKDTGLKTPSWDPNGIHLKIPPITPLVLFQKLLIMLVPTENFLWDSSEFLSGVYQEFLWGFRAFKWFQSKTCF